MIQCCSTTGLLLKMQCLSAVALLGLMGLCNGVANAAQSVTLAWDPSPDPSATGYHLYYGTGSRAYSGRVDAGAATMASVNNLSSGQTYFFAVAAYNQMGIESEMSAEISYSVPAPLVALLRILRGGGLTSPARLQFLVPTNHPYRVQASRDLQSWTTIHTNVSQSTNWIDWLDPQQGSLAHRFYRLAVD